MGSANVDAGGFVNRVAALLLLLLMPAVAASVVLGAQLYLGRGVRYSTMLMVASLALFIYAANGLSDSVEDVANNAAKADALRRHAVWTLALSGCGIVVAGLLLALQHRLHRAYAVILSVGLVYSFRVIPHPLRGGRPPVRLKDILLVKNLTIGATWAAAAFWCPVLDLETAPAAPARVGIVGVSYALLVAVNSLFCDVRDEPGDRACNVNTLPVRFGAERCFRGTMVLMVLWTAFLCAAFARGVLDAPHLAILGALALGYPAVVWLSIARLQPSQAVSSGVIESSDILFMLGLVALS